MFYGRGHSHKQVNSSKDDTDQINVFGASTSKSRLAKTARSAAAARQRQKNVQRKVTAANLRADFPTVKRLAGVTTTKKLFYEDLEANCLLCESSNCGFFLYSR